MRQAPANSGGGERGSEGGIRGLWPSYLVANAGLRYCTQSELGCNSIEKTLQCPQKISFREINSNKFNR